MKHRLAAAVIILVAPRGRSRFSRLLTGREILSILYLIG